MTLPLVRRTDGKYLNLAMARVLRDCQEKNGIVAGGFPGPICERVYFLPNLSMRKLLAQSRNMASGCSEPVIFADWKETPESV